MAVTDEDREKFLELLDEFGSDISEARKLQDNEIEDALMLPGSKTDGESGQQEFVTVTYGQVKGSGGGVQIVNNLVDGGINKALSAEMGKTLKGMIDQGGGGGQGTVKGAKVGSGSTISPDSNGIVTLPNYAENATKVESSSTNGNIKINGTETKVFEMPSSDPYTTARTPLSHSHGNIANGGTLSDTAADAAGNDRLVIRDADNNKIQTSTIKGTDVADAVSKKHSHSNKSVLDSITQEKMESWDNASSGGVTNVSYNGTTKAITKTVGGQTTEVVSASTLKADMGLTKSDIGLGKVTNAAQVKRSEMGVANGVATLGSDGKVPSSQLPSYVDDVIDLLDVTGTAPSTCAKDDKYYNTSSNKIFTATAANTWGSTGETPEAGKIYVNLANSKTYRWSGTTLAVISETIALGETSSTAYRGDRGKTAYDHSQSAHARADATKVEASSTNGNIKINGTETKVFEMPSSDPYTTARTPLSHSHGNIANGGTLSDTAADAAGNDRLVIRDADNNKIQTSTIKGTDVADAVSKKHSHSNKSVLDSITQEKMESWDNASSGGVTNVSYNGTTKAITKTVGGQTTEVVSASTLKADMGLTKSDIGLGKVTNDAQVKRSEMGVAGGVATLGSDGKVPSIQLPAISAAQYTQKVFLEENGGVLTRAMVNTQNTIYVIQHDYIISANITIPAGCMLEFAGGSLRNGQDGSFRITSTNTYVKNYTIDCISNLLVVNGFIPVESNTHNNGKPIYTLECFGDYRTDALAVLTLALQNSLNRIIYVNEDITVIQNTALNLVSNYTTLASENNAKITFTGTITFYASSYLTIKDIHLHFDTISQYDQLFVSGSNHITIENIEMSGTTNSSDGQRYGGGIHVINSLNTNIRNNRIYNVFLNGILLHSDCMYADITNNFVDGTTNIGIEVEGRSGALGTTVAHPCSNVTIINNQLYNCSDGGILINFSNGINVIGNIIKYSKTGIHSISNQDVVISSNIVLVNGSALMIDQEFFGDISLTNSNITVSDNSMVGGIANNLTGQEHVIKALVPIQNASNVKLVNNTFRIHRLVNNRDKINDCVIAILSSKYIKVLNNQISGFTGALPTKYNTGIIIGRSYNVVQTENWFEVTDELQQIPSDIKIDNNTIANVVYGISTIIPNSTEAVPYTDGVENKVNQLQVCNNTIQNCDYDINIGQYSNDWKVEGSVLIGNTHNNYPSSGTTSEIPQIMTGAVKGAEYFDTSLEKPIFWSGNRWVDATGADVPNPE